jgi:hypothetical protein
MGLGKVRAITSNAVGTLASKCRELEVIDLECCRYVGDDTLAKIAEYYSKFEVLRVSGCPNVTAFGLTEIATKCTKLKTVYFASTLILRHQTIDWTKVPSR